MPSQTDVILYALVQLAGLVLPPETLALFTWSNGQVVGLADAEQRHAQGRV